MKSKQAQLETLRKKMLKADLHLKETANNLVFGHGSCHASVFFIGEAPGKNEDLQGLPFIGSAGKILNQLLESISLERADAYITSILKYRPPNNRNPSLKEIISHTPYLIEQIRIIKPKVIVPLGNFATRFVMSGFNVEEMSKIAAISKLRGSIKEMAFEDIKFKVIALYHPAAVLYNSSLRKTLEKDFKILDKVLKQ
jgi:uracil-DNA glycosylase family 4